MKIYKIVAKDALGLPEPADFEIVWVGSKAEGVLRRKQMLSEGWTRKEITETEMDIPKDKQGLLAWLNANAA
jgi:hypothetical protein